MLKGTRKVHFSFDETHLTHFGGMWLIQRFCNQLKIRWLLVVKKQRQNIVRLPHDFHYQKEFLQAFQKISKLRLPQKFRFCK